MGNSWRNARIRCFSFNANFGHCRIGLPYRGHWIK
jgi:hypothetical protein